MNLVLIHGISQEAYTEADLLAKWSKLITDEAPGLLDGVNTQMAYYGKELARWTTGDVKAAIAMGVADGAFDPANNDEINFLVRALEQAAVGQNISDADIAQAARAAEQAAGAEAVPMGTWLGRRLVGIVRALEVVSPLKGALMLQVVKQAYTYLAKNGAGKAVDDLVRPRLDGKRLIIISHSLGTVVAFKLLREMTDVATSVEVPLLITLGSPLGIDAVKAKLGPPRKKPQFVKRWVNFYDPADFVALGKGLDESTFATNIENVGDVDNPTSNAHGIAGYLPDKRVIEALKAVL
ncbi:hypothetical protein NKH16_19155 [Mesorhizobium sp. M1307]|uniref:hypothetical protein n=1 Tax=unclassified Mesorhizobium TaxID=325217 RepID=UPI00333B1AF4